MTLKDGSYWADVELELPVSLSPQGIHVSAIKCNYGYSGGANGRHVFHSE